MPTLKRIRELFDEQREVAAWAVLAFAFWGMAEGRLEQWPGVALVALALVTMLGSHIYSGIRVGNIEVE